MNDESLNRIRLAATGATMVGIHVISYHVIEYNMHFNPNTRVPNTSGLCIVFILFFIQLLVWLILKMDFASDKMFWLSMSMSCGHTNPMKYSFDSIYNLFKQIVLASKRLDAGHAPLGRNGEERRFQIEIVFIFARTHKSSYYLFCGQRNWDAKHSLTHISRNSMLRSAKRRPKSTNWHILICNVDAGLCVCVCAVSSVLFYFLVLFPFCVPLKIHLIHADGDVCSMAATNVWC